jgi:hypothetical protein
MLFGHPLDAGLIHVALYEYQCVILRLSVDFSVMIAVPMPIVTLDTRPNLTAQYTP